MPRPFSWRYWGWVEYTSTSRAANCPMRSCRLSERGKRNTATAARLDVHLDGEYVELTYHLRRVPFDRIRRITGYLVGTLDRFNDGKRAEERDRVKHGMGAAMNDWFEWNGVRCTQYGIHVSELPPPTIPSERVTYTNVPGRPGSLTTLEGEDVYEDVVLTAQCFLSDPTKIPAIAAWLKGSGKSRLRSPAGRLLLRPHCQSNFF